MTSRITPGLGDAPGGVASQEAVSLLSRTSSAQTRVPSASVTRWYGSAIRRDGLANDSDALRS